MDTGLNATQSYRIPVIQRKEYTVSLQVLKLNSYDLTFVHCDVHSPWSPEIKDNLKRDWNTLLSIYNRPLMALNELSDAKHRKFLGLFGFQLLQEISGDDGIQRNLYFHPAKE